MDPPAAPSNVQLRHRHFRTTPRTPGCTERSSETSRLTNTSNFVSHMKVCPHLPAGESYAAWVARGYTALEVVASKDGVRLPSGDAGDGIGIEHEKVREVTQRGFRELFVKAVLQDDLPFSFGENEGMNKVFSYILPDGITVPHKNMVRRDLDLLHAALMKSVDISIEVRSRFLFPKLSVIRRHSPHNLVSSCRNWKV